MQVCTPVGNKRRRVFVPNMWHIYDVWRCDLFVWQTNRWSETVLMPIAHYLSLAKRFANIRSNSPSDPQTYLNSPNKYANARRQISSGAPLSAIRCPLRSHNPEKFARACALYERLRRPQNAQVLNINCQPTIGTHFKRCVRTLTRAHSIKSGIN